MSDEQAALDTHQAFYTAFAARDMAAMERIWAHEARVCCIHPGWAPLIGRAPVIESWAAILSDAGAPEISCGDSNAILKGLFDHNYQGKALLLIVDQPAVEQVKIETKKILSR